MYDLILTYMGERAVMDTGLNLDYCNAMINYLYENIVTDPTVRLTCEAPL